ncbi:MAG: HlyD family efflux transporter periplasmic adaptor subunit [Flavobacteriaceae bacterium]|nr:HlyD family efflux transporter periplasmic adaptor subunit [Flavobacteriaceae bacterium]
MIQDSQVTYTLENLYYHNKVKKFTIYTVVIFVIALVIILLPFINIDISTQSRGIIRSQSENVPISNIVRGRVTYINLYNNQNIQKGDTLVTVETTTLDAETTMNADIQRDLSAILEDLNRVTSGRASSLQTSEIQREYQTYIQRYQGALASREQAQKTYNRNKLLYNQGVISASEMEQYEHDLRIAKTSLQTLEQQQYASWQTHKREIIQQIKNYSGVINQIEAGKKNYYIIAPISGSITNFTGIQKGTFLYEGTIVAEISVQDSLRIETFVSPNDIGLIKEGQSVKFQIDTYNYNQWGMLTGEVSNIDQDISIEQNGSAYFKVWCKLDKNYLQLKNGYKGQIKKGMTLTTRFYINRRSLWELLYDKVDNWLNPKIITTEQDNE